MAENRIQRQMESRDTDMRDEAWSPPQSLPSPNPQDGWAFRWIRVSILGQSDPTNASARFREGWVPVKAAECPELMVHVDPNSTSRFKDNIEIGGLVLCKAPTRMVQQRDEYYRNQAQSQMEAVDNSFLRQNDPRMPMDRLGPAIERKSAVVFGKGSRK